MDEIISFLVFCAIVYKFVVPIIKKNMGQQTGNQSKESAAVNNKVEALRKAYQEADNYKPTSSAMPHKHETTYVSANKKSPTDGAMPHKHQTTHVTANRHKLSDGAMPHKNEEVKYKHIDVSTLPPGYILLNGEPVRTKDLEDY